MGEIAEAMVYGALCFECGSYIGEDADFPRKCLHCRREDRQSALPRFNRYAIPPREGTIECPYCASHPKRKGLSDHIRSKHPEHVKSEGKK